MSASASVTSRLVRFRHRPGSPACRSWGQPDAQAGASMAGFAIIALPFITLALGTVEIAHWFSTRQMISLALVEAARAASTMHNHPQVLAEAFDGALRPRYTMGSSDRTHERVQQALQRRQRDLGHAWEITVVSPSYQAFADFSRPDLRLPAARGHAVIRNSYQAEQHQHAIDSGWTDGRGPQSGQTIYEANTLVLEAVWPHRPSLPPLRAILRQLANPGASSYANRAMALGYLPMRRHITMTMQSHPVRWSATADARIRLPFNTPEPCKGWLCQQTQADRVQDTLRPLDPEPGAGTLPTHETGAGPGEGSASIGPDEGSAAGHAREQVASGEDQFPVTSPDDPACGVSLCCV